MEHTLTQNEQQWTDQEYQDHVLSGVSRTFALTIPELPAGLREVVGNAYLLCRIADTIEDDGGLSAVEKRQHSEQFIDVVCGAFPASEFAARMASALSPETPAAEQDLLRNTARVIRMTHSFRPAQRSILERCVTVMARGMSEFQAKERTGGLTALGELDSYCYYVAGVVGEMLTDLFCDYSTEIARNRPQMMELAVSFGQGLQMTNILKDVWDDKGRGACWLPRTEFQRYGIDLSDLAKAHDETGFGHALGNLIGIACGHLHNALSYTLLIPSHETGIRRFCLWALGMAVLTLRKINKNRGYSSGEQVKISRRAVRGTVVVTSLAARHDRLLRLLFYLAARGLPPQSNELHSRLSDCVSP